MSDTIVRLNVGGRVFETTESTLRFDGVDNFFTALISDRTPSLKDSSGAYFIDRDPDYFTIILRFMRTRKLDTGTVHLTSLYDEALYYSLDALGEIIQNKINKPELADVGDVVGPRLDGAYVNNGNTKAIMFQCNGDDDETEKRIILIEEAPSRPRDTDPKTTVDAFAQARVARAASAMPSLWNEWNKVDYAAFFYKYIRRGKFLLRHENGTTFLSLIVPGNEHLTQTKMAILSSKSRELLVFTSAVESSFVRYKFYPFNELAFDW